MGMGRIVGAAARVLSTGSRRRRFPIRIIKSLSCDPRPSTGFHIPPRPGSSSLFPLLPALFLSCLSITPLLAQDSDDSVISNIHTSKWRVFTDNARDLFFQGKLEDAERLFIGALEQAKLGFGIKDPHVASSCNNLAELYRVKKVFDKAQPLYIEAISILEASYGDQDIRVGAALHNLGQFYLVQNKYDDALICYERALKIKRQALGEGHLEYAETMYHLGKVLYLKGNQEDAQVLIKDSIRIIEEGGQGESLLCIRRLKYLVQMYIKMSKFSDALEMQRKMLRKMEMSKGWESLETVIAAETLALIIIQSSPSSQESLMEAKQLLQKCLDSRRKLLPKDHIQIAANMLHMARVEFLLEKKSSGDVIRDHLGNAIRIAQQTLDKQGDNAADKQTQRTALLILLQALNALSQLGVKEADFSKAEKALLDCISAYKQFGIPMSLSDIGEIKAEYLSCLNHVYALLKNNSLTQSRRPTLQEVLDEIKRVESGSSKSSQKS